MRGRISCCTGIIIVGILSAADASAQALPSSQVFVDDFEAEEVSWHFETSNAGFQPQIHARSTFDYYEGNQSEQIRFRAGLGSGVYYVYPLPRVSIRRDLRITVYVKSNRDGIKLQGQLVLPQSRDPDSAQPFRVNVIGTSYDAPGHWQRLELSRVPELMEQQVRLLRNKTQERVETEDAYLDRLVLNAYGGSGDTEVFIDELRVAPVPLEVIQTQALGDLPPLNTEVENADAQSGDRIRFEGQRLSLLDEPFQIHRPWIPTVIDAPGASFPELRRAGFDLTTVRLEQNSDELQRALDAGLLLMPKLGTEGLGADPSEVNNAVDQLRDPSAVAFWHLGERLGAAPIPAERAETLARVRSSVAVLEDRSEVGLSTLATGDITRDLSLYARRPNRLQLLGIPSNIWGTMTSPRSSYRYLTQRRDLTGLDNPRGSVLWTWIRASAAPELQEAVWGFDAPPSWGTPRILPEQIRQAAFIALMAGYRGLGVSGDPELTRDAGRAQLLELALLNGEIDLFQPILADPAGPIHTYQVFPGPSQESGRPLLNNYSYREDDFEKEPAVLGDVVAVGFPPTPERRGTLMLVADLRSGSQWIPGQLARDEIRVIVPGMLDQSATLITVGSVQNLPAKRVPGGLEVTIRNFGPTAWVLLTNDQAGVQRLEQAITQYAPKAAELAIELAEIYRRDILEVHSVLGLDGHDVRDSGVLIQRTDDEIAAARADLTRGDAQSAFDNARRSARPLQILMGSYAADALEELVEVSEMAFRDSLPIEISAVSAPPLMSFNTLPRLYIWTDAIRSYPFRPILEGGDFEETDPSIYQEAGWASAGDVIEGLDYQIEIVPLPEGTGPEVTVGQSVLGLRVQPTEGRSADEFPPAPSRPTVAIQSPPTPVNRHEFVRISVLAYMPRFQPESSAGLIVRDSLGGELMQYRIPRLGKWSRIVMYRRAPEDHDLTVTLGLIATAGEVYFDDLRIERLTDPNTLVDSSRDPVTLVPSPDPSSSTSTGVSGGTVESAPVRSRPSRFTVRPSTIVTTPRRRRQ